MAYIQGNLNQKVRLKDYEGIATQTAKVIIDDDNNTIGVEVTGLPSGCYPMPRIPEDTKNGELATVSNGRWKLTDIKAALPKFTKHQKNNILSINEEGTDICWRKVQEDFIIYVDKLPTVNINDNAIYHYNSSFMMHDGYSWFKVADAAVVEILKNRVNAILTQLELMDTIYVATLNITHTSEDTYIVNCDTTIRTIFTAESAAHKAYKMKYKYISNGETCYGDCVIKKISQNNSDAQIKIELQAGPFEISGTTTEYFDEFMIEAIR